MSEKISLDSSVPNDKIRYEFETVSKTYIIGQKTCINSNDLFRDSLKTVKIMFETKATILRSSKHFE